MALRLKAPFCHPYQYYERQVKDLQEYMDMVGPEQFARTTFEIEYSYEDEEEDE